MPAHPSVISALTAAVEATPDDLPLRLHLGSLLLDAGEHARALDQFVAVLTRAPDDVDALRGATAAAEALGEHTRSEGYRRLLRALRETETSPPAPSERSTAGPRPPEGRDDSPVDWDRLLGPRGVDGPPVPLRAAGSAEEISAAVETPEITLTDVGGMGEVKRRLNLAFLAPLRNPELMRMYGKSLRGGLMLYGPPGCGKTYIARALAGELGAKFIAVGLADVLDMWLGESEKRLQQIFDTARRTAPSVLFFDEIDALGQKRSHLTHHAGRNVVNQLLAELDSIGGNNDGVFVLAATNHPWDVDTALRRPGRFDRMMLVLPPDEPAREVILHTHLKGRPADGVDTRWVAAKTQEFSGADLAHLCEAAAEHAMEESISTGRARSITTADFRRAVKECRPSTRPWFEVARNYAMFANEGGTYDELLEYLRANKI